jgi:hypothetical protein
VQLGYGSGKFSLVDHRLEATVPAELQEEAGAVPGLDLIAMSVRHVQNVMALERESIAASLARNAGNYSASNKETLSGTSQWSHASSDPFTDIMDGKEVIRSQIGIEPNSLAVAPKVLKGLRSHPKVLDRPPATIQQLKALFELENIVAGGAVHHDGTSFQDLWGKDAVLAYTTPASMEDMGSPNYGYTYQLRNYPEVEEGYFDPNTNSWYYPTKDAYQPVLVGASAGFLFKDAVA